MIIFSQVTIILTLINYVLNSNLLGKAVIVPDEKIAEAEKLFSLHEFNMVASQMISYNRTYPDLRDPKYVIDNA